ncbi:putative amidohydrolase [Roseivirga pacifica]|uniref:Omega-amidase YafV n=1 Tax=Roseivirga pacifica TaxID=1267423 RepID=A0A1I0RMQ0_9BACT|nr:amidohydrolase [Roseivirga pacifica]RKQ49890.1 putative amidohydrolase [Roseivirga pacifica]SEW42475.1 Predicted amidohydrolase [Roseivirga pacifica]
MSSLKLALIQSSIHWHEVQANLAMFEEKIWQITEPVDIIVLPEMFQTGFTMETSLAEPMNLTTFKWMKQMAAQKKAVVTGSYIVKEGEKVFNRLVWMFPDGTYKTYDKRHLFRMANEDQHFDGGSEKLVVQYKGWSICPLICYDLRFPVWSRNVDLEYDLLLYVANWPAARVSAWDALLKARAIENVSYAVGLNRVGEDGLGIAYNGHMGAYSPKGETLMFSDKEETVIVTLEKGELDRFREKFPAQLDADKFSIER